jgi:uncharacterized protein (TIGR03086 family)
MDPLDALDRAVQGFDARLALVEDVHWPRPTPCEAWDVRFLVAHVVGGNRFAAQVLDGASADAAMEHVLSQPQLGAEPRADFASSSAAQRERFRTDGALRRTVSHPVGDMSAAQFLDFRIFDIAVHAWDLARAIGADDALDPALAQAALDIIQSAGGQMGFGITPSGQAAQDASAQERLLDLAGRRGE